MNLHEECLLKYLLNPSDLSRSTEILKQNNFLIEKGIFGINLTNSNSRKNYTITRI